MFRSTHGAEYTARGVANGVFWGMTPLIGLQTLGILATWIIGRRVFGKDGSLLQAFIWAWVNNPFTVVPMYYGFYVTGLWLTGHAGQSTGYASFVATWDATENAGWLERARGLAQAVGVPLLVGCLPWAALTSTLCYKWSEGVVRRRRERLGAART